MSKLERLYYFHNRVRAGHYPNTTCLVEEFEISPATAHRDIAYLRDRLLAPLVFHHRKNGFFYDRDDFRLPFENSPAMTLVLGLLGNLASEAGLNELPGLAMFRKQLQGVIFPGQRNIDDLLYCEWVEKEPIGSGIFPAVLATLKDSCCLRLQYQPLGGKTSRRTVEPLQLVNYQGRWYLLAWCRLRQERRLFSLARMQEAIPLDDPVTRTLDPRDDWLSQSFGIFKGPATFRALIRFTGTAAELVRRQQWHPDQRLEVEDKAILLSLPVADDRELLMRILQFGSQAEILQPQWLRTAIKQQIDQMRKIYD